VTPKTLIGASIFLLALSAGLGILNTQRARGLRAQVTQAEVARKAAEQLRIEREKQLNEAQTKIARTEEELVKVHKEKVDLPARLHGSEPEIVQLVKRSEEAKGEPVVSTNDLIAPRAFLQTRPQEATKQPDAAEGEKALLSDKIRASRERSIQLEREDKRRLPSGGNPGIRGTVLAVNQAYNFVVLNLGARQGVELNSEMLVLRGGSFIGKIRISSVEPATAIGDIITSTLARGVQVQTGDTVIYAGTNS
jgi:hypothetical protein